MSNESRQTSREQVPELQGSLGQMDIIDVLQFLNTGGKSGELMIKNLPEGRVANLYFQSGNLIHAVMGDVEGMEVLEDMPHWDQGDFIFLPDILSSKSTIDLPFHHLIMEVVRQYDEKKRTEEGSEDPSEVEPEAPVSGRRKKMATLRDLLDDLVRIEGINTAVLVGRDGFVIDGIDSGGRLDVEDIGAVISTGIGSSEVMGNELSVGTLNQTMVEFEKGIILVNLVGENAILAVVADLKTPLGNVRYQVKKRLADIRDSLES